MLVSQCDRCLGVSGGEVTTSYTTVTYNRRDQYVITNNSQRRDTHKQTEQGDLHISMSTYGGSKGEKPSSVHTNHLYLQFEDDGDRVETQNPGRSQSGRDSMPAFGPSIPIIL
jgi:hypothetical protein